MLIDRIALRPRPPSEAMDLGLRLVQARWPIMLGASCLAILPSALLAALAWLWWPPLALLVLWWGKPLIDRTILALLAAELGQQPLGAREAARRGLAPGAKTLLLLLWRLRLHPARSMVLAVSQLEGLAGAARRRRTSALGSGGFGPATGLTLMGQFFEACILLSLISLFSWLLPDAVFNNIAYNPASASLLLPASMWAWLAGLYAITIILVEPFYLGAGFGLYLNQRCRLECWDLEFTLRRLATRHAGEQAA